VRWESTVLGWGDSHSGPIQTPITGNVYFLCSAVARSYWAGIKCQVVVPKTLVSQPVFVREQESQFDIEVLSNIFRGAPKCLTGNIVHVSMEAIRNTDDLAG